MRLSRKHQREIVIVSVAAPILASRFIRGYEVHAVDDKIGDFIRELDVEDDFRELARFIWRRFYDILSAVIRAMGLSRFATLTLLEQAVFLTLVGEWLRGTPVEVVGAELKRLARKYGHREADRLFTATFNKLVEGG